MTLKIDPNEIAIEGTTATWRGWRVQLACVKIRGSDGCITQVGTPEYVAGLREWAAPYMQFQVEMMSNHERLRFLSVAIRAERRPT